MQTLLWLMLAVVVLIPAVLAHAWLPRHAENRPALWLLRVLLWGAGVLAGYRGLLYTGGAEGLHAAAVFLTGFGLVQLPAFFVLLIKRRRGEYGRG